MREIVEMTAAIEALHQAVARLTATIESNTQVLHYQAEQVRQASDARSYRLTEAGRMLRKDAAFVRAALLRFGLPNVTDGQNREAITHATFRRLEAALDREAAGLAARERLERIRKETERNRELRRRRINHYKGDKTDAKPNAKGVGDRDPRQLPALSG